jgi:hypothetical protein
MALVDGGGLDPTALGGEHGNGRGAETLLGQGRSLLSRTGVGVDLVGVLPVRTSWQDCAAPRPALATAFQNRRDARAAGRENAHVLFLVPSDVLRPRRPDDHFAAEADAARALGWQVALVDHDALASGDDERAVSRVPSGDAAIYRGWMLDSPRYAAFATALATRGVALRTDAASYRRAHELPGWYAALAGFTPASVWTTGTDRPPFDAARRSLGHGAGVLRDYTKSMKHYWHEAAYIPDLADAGAAWKVASRMRDLRGEDFTGGFVLRRFEHFTGAEARTWWVNGTCRLITAHPDTPDELPPDVDVAFLQPAVKGLALPFVTVDLTRDTTGAWRVVELGDGQVSDRPTTTSPETMLNALRHSHGAHPAGEAEA